MSSNNEYAIQVQDVSKIYKLYDKPIDRLKESLSLTHKNYHKDFFALSDISFNVKKGETVGIIGTKGIKKKLLDIRENVRGVDEVKQEVAHKQVAKVR